MRRSMVASAMLLALGVLPSAAFVRPKSEPAPKRRDCPEIGEGYVRLPGSDICVRLSGLVRVEAAHQSGSR